ncbi:hypothetical protein KR51_00017470 [Rubidibacter lacunae KORDI 51-2]|uniref:Uncharacterized protein n=1 Tax=Rubidibacter lacunae KORDI 51-2 TaxID=582515 RepID=U5DLC2_9CHRO|nr:hypothetical protein [Rubidibacter lacunae]ERN41667.1 hypothetical protein KR51_00017470 [Rubidibacter lacunae KORDI 51-2]
MSIANRFIASTTALAFSAGAAAIALTPQPANAHPFRNQTRSTYNTGYDSNPFGQATYRQPAYTNVPNTNDTRYDSGYVTFGSRDNTAFTNSRARNATIPAGVTIPVRYAEAEKILVTPEETLPLTLSVAANIRDRRGSVLIPAGSSIVGEIVPAGGGSQFVARELIFADTGRAQAIYGSSQIVTRTETIREGAKTAEILGGAAAGAAAAAIIAGVTGNSNAGVFEVLGGAGGGALTGWLIGRDRAELISIDPNRDLDVILQSRLSLSR